MDENMINEEETKKVMEKRIVVTMEGNKKKYYLKIQQFNDYSEQIESEKKLLDEFLLTKTKEEELKVAQKYQKKGKKIGTHHLLEYAKRVKT